MAAGVPGSRSLLTDIQAEIGSTIDIDGYWSLKGIMLFAINDEKIKGTALKVLLCHPLYCHISFCRGVTVQLDMDQCLSHRKNGNHKFDIPFKSLIMCITIKGKISINITQQIGYL